MTAGIVPPELATIAIAGVDAGKFLHGQLSADVAALAVGQGCETLLLTPKGKVVAPGALVRAADDRFLFAVARPLVADATARLEMFRLRVDAEISPANEGSARVWPAKPGDFADAGVIAIAGGGALATTYLVGDLGRLGLRNADPEDWTAARVDAGEAVFGVDFDGSTIPHDAGLVPRMVGLDKGCYTGQELIERVYSRGHANRRPTMVDFGDAAPPPAGSPVVAGEREVGVVSTVAVSSHRAMGLLRVDVEPGTAVDVAGVPGRVG